MTTYTDGVWTTLTTPNDTTKSAITVTRVIQGGDLVMVIIFVLYILYHEDTPIIIV